MGTRRIYKLRLFFASPTRPSPRPSMLKGHCAPFQHSKRWSLEKSAQCSGGKSDMWQCVTCDLLGQVWSAVPVVHLVACPLRSLSRNRHNLRETAELRQQNVHGRNLSSKSSSGKVADGKGNCKDSQAKLPGLFEV